MDGLLQQLRRIDETMRRLDRTSPEYDRLASELTRVSREVFWANDGPGTEIAHRSDAVDRAIDALDDEDDTAA